MTIILRSYFACYNSAPLSLLVYCISGSQLCDKSAPVLKLNGVAKMSGVVVDSLGEVLHECVCISQTVAGLSLVGHVTHRHGHFQSTPGGE